MDTKKELVTQIQKSIVENSYPFQFIGINEEGTFIYYFESIGALIVKKKVRISVLHEGRPDIYNIALVNEELDDYGNTVESDTSKLNNLDWDKVLNTVFLCGFDFVRLHSWAYLIFFGNSFHKQIVYKRKVTANLKMLEQEFNVYGGFATYDIEYEDASGNVVLPADNDFEKKKNGLTKNPVNVIFTGYELYEKDNSKKYDFILMKLRSA